MKHSFLYTSVFIFLLTVSLSACSQGDSTRKPLPFIQHHLHSFGSSAISVKETTYNNDIPILFVQLHSNETTADDVTSSLSEKLGIDYIQVLNANERLISFTIGNSRYMFDPNRMFSEEGIAATLRAHSVFGERALLAIDEFSDFFLGLLDVNKTIVAVHNNTQGAFTLANYRINKTGLVYQNPSLDPDDFFITTDSTIFNRIRENKFNVVLEYTRLLKQDGSLSIFCGRNGIPYVNVEAQHGHNKEQKEMLQLLIRILK